MTTSTSTIPFHTFSSSAPIPSPTTTSFKLSPSATELTDIWRKPSNSLSGPSGAVYTFNAPLIYKSIPLSKFRRCKVTFTAKYETLYDQGGLVFVLPAENGGKDEEELARTAKWLKSGVEFVQERAWIGTVGCDRWADWSLAEAGIRDASEGGGKKTVTLELKREGEGTLWVYVVEEDGTRVPVRENTWLLSPEGNGGSPDRELWVGIFAATPILDGREKTGALTVDFEDWELELED